MTVPRSYRLLALGRDIARQRSDLLVALMLLGWTAWFWNGPLINDVGWQMWIGRRMSEGALLYRDILEINPPLWFWIGEALVRAGDFIQVRPAALLVAGLGAGALLALALIRSTGASAPDRMLLGLGLVSTLFLTAPFALGQREQWVVIATLPYVALQAARMEERRVSSGAVLAIALLAASGIALKHYFVALPLALELWLVVRRRTFSLRLEHGVLLLAGAAYIAAILLLTPDYIHVMVPMIATAYGGFDLPLLTLIANPFIFAVCGALGLLLLGRPSSMTQAAGVAAVAFALAFIVQAKNFSYQAVPALGFAIVSTLLAASRPDGRRPALLLLIVGACAAVPAWAGFGRIDRSAAQATADLAAGSRIMVLSSSGTVAWPLVEERGFEWNSPHMMLWMLGPHWRDMTDGTQQRDRQLLAHKIRREVARELACLPPDRLLVDRRYDVLLPGMGVLGWFRADPAFTVALKGYARRPDHNIIEVWERKAETGTPAASTACPSSTGSAASPVFRP